MVSPRLQRMSESTRTEEEAATDLGLCLKCYGHGHLFDHDKERMARCSACHGTGKAEKAE